MSEWERPAQPPAPLFFGEKEKNLVKQINDEIIERVVGQQWIRKFSLALSKETLGQVRGKFGGNVPIPGDNITLNASDLLSQAQAEQTTLREELNKQLDEMLYAKIAETDKAMTDNMDSIVGKTPLKIFVG